MMKKRVKEERKRAAGRPQEFAGDLVPEKTLQVFRDKGHVFASMAELYGATQVNIPSSYTVFGNGRQFLIVFFLRRRD